jgi:hypothetical protein
MFESLDYVYTPARDVDEAATECVERLGAELVWKVRAFGTVVACLRLARTGPAILLAGHLEGPEPVRVYRVDDYEAALAELRRAGVRDLLETGIPHGPLAVFRAPGGPRLGIYELTRPEAVHRFDGRFDEA